MDGTRKLSANRKCEGLLPSFEELIGNLSGRRPTEHCGCDMNCIINFTKHEKVAILRNFADKSKDEIDNHLYSLIEKREKPKFTYHALKGEERHVVCRKAFISLHNTSTKAVYRLTKLLEKDQV
uniref:Uncharacterized protein n=1 Tax=Timema poppense TaxID=170557 RepID=A0A7R9D474_TIMPO|nr:unnamed protein product [Timema poppensis]